MADNDSHQHNDDGGHPSDSYDNNGGGGGNDSSGNHNGDSGTGDEVKLYVGNLDYGAFP